MLPSTFIEHRLPFAEAAVFRSVSDGALSVTLTGQVRTQFGKQDAETKVTRFLSAQVVFDNQLIVNGDLSVDMVGQNNTVGEVPKAFFGCWDGGGPSSLRSSWTSIFSTWSFPRPYEVPYTFEMCMDQTPDGGFEISSQSASAPLPQFTPYTRLSFERWHCAHRVTTNRSWLTGS